MSNSFNEDYNTYLLEKSILETSNPSINNIETTENIEDKPTKSIEDTLLELENTNELLQGGNTTIIGGAVLPYVVDGKYTITSKEDTFASENTLWSQFTPHISGTSTISQSYYIHNIILTGTTSHTEFTVSAGFYNNINDNDQVVYTRKYTNTDEVEETSTVTYYVSKIVNTNKINLRASSTATDNITITSNSNDQINNIVNNNIVISNHTSLQSKLQFIQMCSDIKNKLFSDDGNIKNWIYIMNNYLLNLLEDISPTSNKQSQILNIQTAILESTESTETTTNTTYNIDLSQIKLKDLNANSGLTFEAKIQNYINELIIQIPSNYILTDLTLFTNNIKQIRWITGIILIILFAICIYNLDISILNISSSIMKQIIKWSIFSIISALIIFMEFGTLLFDAFSIDGITVNNNITMSMIYICMTILIFIYYNYNYITNDKEYTTLLFIIIIICISIGIIWMGNTIYYKIFTNEEAKKNKLIKTLNEKNIYKNNDGDNWIQYSFPVMLFLYICTFIYFLKDNLTFIQEQSLLFILFPFIITIIISIIYFILNKSIYLYHLLGSSGIISIIFALLIGTYKIINSISNNNQILEAPKINYNYILDVIPIYILLLNTVVNISTLNVNQLPIGASIEIIIRIIIIIFTIFGIHNLYNKNLIVGYHIFVLLGCLTMILLYKSENKIMKLEEFNIAYSVISPFMNLVYYMFIVN